MDRYIATQSIACEPRRHWTIWDRQKQSVANDHFMDRLRNGQDACYRSRKEAEAAAERLNATELLR